MVIDKAFVGSSEVDKIYLGTDLVWQALEPGIPVEGAPNGVYILHTNGTLYTREQWKTSYNQDAVGVALVSDNCKFIIGKTAKENLEWGGYGTIINNIETGTNISDVDGDYNGKDNTDKIISQLGDGNSPAACYCKNFTFPDGKKGYLGSMGEWRNAYYNKLEIDDCMVIIGGSKINDAYHWTSSQANSEGAWGFDWGKGNTVISDKDGWFEVRPFAPLT